MSNNTSPNPLASLSLKIKYLAAIFISTGLVLMLQTIFSYFIEMGYVKYLGFNFSQMRDPDDGMNLAHVQNALRGLQFFVGLSMILAAWLTSTYLKIHYLDMYELERKPKWLHILLSIGLIIIILPLMAYLLDLNGKLTLGEKLTEYFSKLETDSERLYDLLLFRDSGIHLFFNLLIMALLPAIAEEVFFRGCFQRILTGYFKNAHIGIVISAVFFTLIHFQPYKFGAMFVIAIAFGYLYYLTSSLWLPIIAHFSNNALTLWARKAEKAGELPEVITQIEEPSLMFALISVALVGGVFYLIKKTSEVRLSNELIVLEPPTNLDSNS